MRSLEDIAREQDEMAQRAASEGKYPYTPEAHELDDEDWCRGIPFIGDYVPAGWTLKENLFVDASGFGADDEPALSIPRFLAKARTIMAEDASAGFALTSTGQFQVHIGVYGRSKSKRGKRDRSVTETRTGWTM